MVDIPTKEFNKILPQTGDYVVSYNLCFYFEGVVLAVFLGPRNPETILTVVENRDGVQLIIKAENLCRVTRGPKETTVTRYQTKD